MLLPSIFTNDFFDDFMNFPTHFERQLRAAEPDSFGLNGLMRTDVKETETGYEIAMDLPGYKKEDVKVSLKSGYLTVAAVRENSSETGEKERYIRREHYTGKLSRSFYVGDVLTQEDIRARFEDGILKLTLPKKDQRTVEERSFIEIEG